MYRVQAGGGFLLGNLFMNSWAGDTYIYGGPYSSEYTLTSVNSQFYNSIWDNTYKTLYNVESIMKFPNADHKQDNYVAVSHILKAFYMQNIVDLYGDIPYSEAWQGGANFTPKYDNDEDVYKALINGIDSGIAMLNNPNSNAIAIGAEDVIFQGNTAKWIQFGNFVKLRYLVRMSNITSGPMVAFRDQKLAEVATALNGVTGLSADVYERPGYSRANDDALNPLALNYIFNAAGQYVQNYSLVTVSEHLANVMEGNTLLSDSNYNKYNGVVDGRKAKLFSSVPYLLNGTTVVNKLKGIRQGATAGSPGAPIYGNDPNTRKTSKLQLTFFYGSNPTGAADAISAVNNRGGALMTISESKFLMAEAALRWPSIFSSVNAQTAFNDGVVSNFQYLGLSTGAAYVSTIASKTGLGWTGSTQDKIEAIMTQKWLSLITVNPLESFIEYNRTGFPHTPLAVNSVMPNKPYRLQYPQSEFAANSGNTPNVPSSALFTKNQYTPFWNQN